MGRAQIAAFHEPVMKERQKAAMMGAAGDADSFGDGLAAAALSIIADGRRALADPELSDAEAVHEVRKALKRWRALLRLLARPLGEQADQMRAEARELMRALSGARDAQSALDALADLRKAGTKADVPFSPTSMETIGQRLTAIKDAAEETGFTQEMRDKLARYLDYATLSLERWPLAAINFDTVADGLISTYRRARQLVPDNWAGGRRRTPARSAPARGRAPPSDGSDGAFVAAARTGVGGGSPAPEEPARRLPGSGGIRRPHRAASAVGAVAFAAHPADRGTARGAFANGGAACRPAICGKAKGVSPAPGGAMGGAAGEEKVTHSDRQ